MKKYLLQRIVSMVVVLFVVTLLVFVIMHSVPGGPAAAMLGMDATAEDIAALESELGLDKPVVDQYLSWLVSALQGDLGQSLFMKMPVSQALAEHLAPTLSLALYAEVIALFIALPLGIASARRKGSLLDRVIRTSSLAGIAVPSFLLALVLVYAFALHFDLFPVSGYMPLKRGIVKHLEYLTLPALSLGIVQAAQILRMTRMAVLEAYELPNVKTARAMGVSERRVLWVHVMRNAALPIVTVIGSSLASLIAGAVVVEVIFGIPGIGQLVINSVSRRDYAVIQGALVFIGFALSVVNLLVDLLYGAIDHRARVWEG